MNNRRGFSLVELMIAVAIIGILSAIAVPQYTSYVAKGNRSEALRELVTVLNLEEQFMIENRTYTANVTELGFDANPFTSENGKYKIHVEAIDDITSNYLVVATAETKQAEIDPLCYKLMMSYLGEKSAESTDGDDTSDICWEKN